MTLPLRRIVASALGARTLAGAALLALPLALGSCEVNPATGRSSFSLMSAAQEQQVGSEEHPKLVQEFGGEIDNAEVKRYVDSVGNLLAKTSEMPDTKFTFSVLDSEIVNAFALPGGYVHITRGLLALANDEAELAGVLGHEIGHVTAHHSAQLYTRSVLSQILAAGIGIATGSGDLGQVAAQGAGIYLKSYSRENEFEADSLGVRYLTRAGFDPNAMASFLKSLEAEAQLDAILAGQPPGTADQFNIMATHPRTVDRVQRAIAEAGEVVHPTETSETGRQVYLSKINGLIYGESPDEGFVRGDRFAHPKLRFEFRVPAGFKMTNTPSAVIARNPNGAVIGFDEVKQGANLTPQAYLARVNVQLSGTESITVNGMQAATGVARVQTNGGAGNLRLVVIRFSPERLFRFLFISPAQVTASLDDAFKRTTYSFKPLSAAEAAALKPLRIRVVRARAGDTVQSLASRMAFPDYQEQRFRVLNGLGPGDGLPRDGLVKIVVDTDVPKDIQ